MDLYKVNIRESRLEDVSNIAAYWTNNSSEQLLAMGADPNKMPSSKQFTTMLQSQIELPYEDKKAYALICEVDGKPSGHCNVNQIKYGDRANMHLHLWHADARQKGVGTEMIRQSIPFFFNNLNIETLYCEPFALNPGPNKTLPKVGFVFVKKYLTIPGPINLEQEVNQWIMTKKDYELRYNTNGDC